MNIKIVADSAADIRALADEAVPFAVASLKIITAEREYVDDDTLNAAEMANDLATYKGRSSSSCPNHRDWIDAFGDAEQAVCVTITSGLSGSYNAACMAKDIYEEEHPGRRVLVIDSLSAGPEMALMIERIRERILTGDDLDTIEKTFDRHRTRLLFVLSSLKNLANNGRVSPLVAKVAGTLGIRMVGTASGEGKLDLLHKCRGEVRALETVLRSMIEAGFAGGRVKIAHCLNSPAAENLKRLIRESFANAAVDVYPTGGLCSFYAERGGLLVGFEV